MYTMTANDAKRHFGEMLDIARRAPVSVEKHGRPVVVVLSVEDYAELTGEVLGMARGTIGAGKAANKKTAGKKQAAQKKRAVAKKSAVVKAKPSKKNEIKKPAPKSKVPVTRSPEEKERDALKRDHEDLFG